jgi:hypothetical protein
MSAGRILFGYRNDVDLNQKWWHRLIKVVYFIAFALTAAGLIFLGLDETTRKPVRIGDVTIKMKLGELLASADKSVPNVIPAFLLVPGPTGAIEPANPNEITWVSEYSLQNSFCTPDAMRHAGYIADYLNKRDYTDKNNWFSVIDSMKGEKPDAQLMWCYMSPALRDDVKSEFVRYQFTALGRIVHTSKYLWPYLAGIVLLHFAAANLYYRGLVYIIVGPRKKPTPSSEADAA